MARYQSVAHVGRTEPAILHRFQKSLHGVRETKVGNVIDELAQKSTSFNVSVNRFQNTDRFFERFDFLIEVGPLVEGRQKLFPNSLKGIHYKDCTI